MDINIQITKRMFNEVYLKELKNYSTRWNFYFGSAGSGKSVFIAQKLIIKLLSEQRRLLVARRYGITLRQSVYQLFKDILKDFKIDKHCKITDSLMYIQFPNGSEILFMGMDDEQKLLSIQDISDVFIEEAVETNKDILEQLSLRMRGRATNHQLHLAFNPISKLNFMYDFMVNNPPNNSMVLKTTYKDNKFLPKEYIDSLEDLYRTNPDKARVYCDGEWGTVGKLVFNNNNYEFKEFNLNDLIKNNYEVRLGCDFGFTLDPTALIATLYDSKNETIYVFDEMYEKGLTNRDIATIIKDKKYHKQLIYFDSAEPKSIVELNRMGIRAKPCKKGRDSISFGLNFLLRHKLIIHPKCNNLKFELLDYQFKKDKNTGLYHSDKFEGSDHLIDALRYAYSDIYTTARFRTFKKSLLGV
jgi:phage terminase large subunit